MLLINSVLPHHHHEEEVCFEASHCSNDESDQHGVHSEKNAVEHEHQHGESDICALASFYLAPDVQKLTNKIKFSILKNDFSNTTDLNNNSNLLIVSNRKVWRFITNGKTELITYCLSRALRAPPYC